MDCKLKNLCGNNSFKLLCQLVLLTFKALKKFVINVLNFIIFHLYGTQNQFALSVNLLYLKSL